MADESGRIIAGRFEVLRTIDSGGMGTVYEVRDRKRPDTRRALKTPLPGKERDESVRQAFAREVTATDRVRSEHVVTVYEFDLNSDPPWMLMELLEGENLDSYVKEPLSWEETRVRVRELGHALGAAHAAGVLHLDLKPSNVFLSRVDNAWAQARLKVIDFGLSRQIQESKTHAVGSRAVGTWEWMPPEQFEDGVELRPSADVWPLGMLTFWMLTRRHYWLAVDDRGVLTKNIFAFMRDDVAKGATVSASQRAAERGVRVRLPDGFDAWFARCVAADPSARWPDGGAASRALEALLERATVPPVADPTSKPVRVVTQEAPRPLPPAGFTERVPPPSEAPRGGAKADRGRATPRWRGVDGAVGVVAVALLVVVGWKLAGGAELSPRALATVKAPRLPPCARGMVHIPEGDFMMGTDGGAADESPAHRVHIRAFCMDPTEVSVRAYRGCVEAGWCTAPLAYAATRGSYDNFYNWNRPGAEDHPVNAVDWRQSTRFCAWPGLVGGARRLPREAEWEYAARGTSNRLYPWGNQAPDGSYANLCGSECAAHGASLGHRGWTGIPGWTDASGGTAPVDSFARGRTPETGLFHMAGNVWEWVDEVYASDAYQRPNAGDIYARDATVASQSTESRVYRGGGWDNNDASVARAADRDAGGPAIRYVGVGFRCAAGAR